MGVFRLEPLNFRFKTSIAGEPVELEKDETSTCQKLTWVHDTNYRFSISLLVFE